MILWHLGTAALLTYLTLGRRRIDFRFVLAGAVLPDLVDPLLSPWNDPGPAARGVAHSLLAPSVAAAAVVLLRSGERRLAPFGLAVGWLLHLVVDGMWEAPETFFWPAFGPGFSASPPEPYAWDLFAHPLAHLGTWGTELVGACILAWFWAAFELGRDGRFGMFLKDGLLRP